MLYKNISTLILFFLFNVVLGNLRIAKAQGNYLSPKDAPQGWIPIFLVIAPPNVNRRL